MRVLYLASVYLHVLAAISWIGGMVFLVAVLAPILRNPATRVHAVPIFHAFGARFRLLGWTALVTLVVTGAFNVFVRGFGLSDWLSGRVFAGEWGRALLYKLSFVTVILIVSVVHDFWIGPYAMRVATERPDSPEREKYRKLASWMGRATFVLALVVVAFAVQLVR